MTPEKQTEKVLRVGIVQGGRIIEERLLRPRTSVTIGQSIKNKFSVPSPRLPMSTTVIEFRDGRHRLLFEKGMLGKVLVGDEILDLKSIAQRGLAERSDNRFSFPLTEGSRGKVVIGDITLLFQFVAPPPEVARLQVAGSRRVSIWQNVDPIFVFSFIFAFVTIFGTFAYVEVWWKQTGRYMAPGTRGQSRLLATLLTMEPQDLEKKKKKEEEKNEEKKRVEREDSPVQGMEKERILTMAGSQALAEAASQSANNGAGADVGIGPDVGVGVDTGAVRVDMGMAPSPNMGGALTRPVPGGGTKVAVVGSMFGEGEGTVADGLSQGRRRATGLLAGPTTVGTPGAGFDGTGSLTGGLGGAGSFNVPTGGLAVAPATFTLPTNPGGEINKQTAEINSGKKEIVVVSNQPVPGEREPEVVFTTSGGGTSDKPEVAEVRKKIRGRSSGIQRCYKTEVRKNRQLAGKVKVRVQVDNNGLATVTVVEDQMAGSNVSQCIVGILKGIVFNKARADIYQTFVFSAQ